MQLIFFVHLISLSDETASGLGICLVGCIRDAYIYCRSRNRSRAPASDSCIRLRLIFEAKFYLYSSQLGQLSVAFFWDSFILAGVKVWQVTLCDPI